VTQAWLPYCGPAPTPDGILGRWNTDPVLLLALGVGLAALVALRRSPRDRTWAALGILALAVSFVSPLCAASSALFTARTIHHLWLMAVAAPLFAWCLPKLNPGHLATATLVQALVLWAWHAPPLYAQALSNDGVYWLMQLSLLGSAIGFWAAVRRAGAPAATGALLVTLVQTGLLGAILTFAPQALYLPHAGSTGPWGLSWLEDQQLAGLVMWAPGAGLYLAAALGLLLRALSDQHAPAGRPA